MYLLMPPSWPEVESRILFRDSWSQVLLDLLLGYHLFSVWSCWWPFFFFNCYLLIFWRESERQKERNIDLVFHLFVHSLVSVF